MSATKIILRLLMEDPDIDAAVYPIVVPETADTPFIVVGNIFEEQDFVIEGAQRTFQSRLSVACHADSPAAADALGETVKRCLEAVVARELTDNGSPELIWAIATIWKAGSDVSDYSDDRTVFRRLIDWNVRWERVI